MGASYSCLSCGMNLPEEQVSERTNVVKCPQCGGDMYRSFGSEQSPGGSSFSGGRPQAQIVVPSRYRTGASDASLAVEAEMEQEREAKDLIVPPHTPFIVVVGFIFSILFPPAGIIISIMGLRLVKQSPVPVKGKGLAIAGIVVGAAFMLLGIIMVAAGGGQ